MNSAQVSTADAPAKGVNWYRCKLPKEEYRALLERSDVRGLAQALGHLGLLLGAGALALYSFSHWPWWATVLAVYFYGSIASFLINAVHELCHGTVFRTKWLHGPFVRTYAFLGWVNHEVFTRSHALHHRHTLHPPDDLEVVLPIRIGIRKGMLEGFFNFQAVKWGIGTTIRLARGRFEGEWENKLFPAGDPALAARPIRWARIVLAGHALILALALWQGWWLVPVLTLIAPFCGGWLNFFCNSTQHVGLSEKVNDFRLNSRSFHLHPFVSFLYWHMNYHIEHHMFAAVPCYHLRRLHQLVKNDMPPCYDGLIPMWRDIIRVLDRQEREPGYEYVPPLPSAVNQPRHAQPQTVAD